LADAVSVALCTYNGEKYLVGQLQSFLRQSLLPAEIVVCDDASADETIRIVRDFAAASPVPVRWQVNPENLGSSRNFERAIVRCAGDIIVLSDQDDVWRPDKIARIVETFAARPRAGLVFSDAEVVDRELNSLGYTLWQSMGFGPARQRAMRAPGGALRVLLKHTAVAGATMAFRAGLRPLLCPIGDGWIHDEWIALLSAGAGEIVAIPEPLVLYRQHGGNQIGGLRRTAFDRAGAVRATGRDSATARIRSLARQYREAAGRLAQFAGNAGGAVPLDPLLEKIAHLETRARLRGGGRLPRTGLAVTELAKGGYHRYSAGWASFLKDVF
jgi:glycosyltransferase involved in cell wall biosynthesis